VLVADPGVAARAAAKATRRNLLVILALISFSIMALLA
jgi:hypothetical protein